MKWGRVEYDVNFPVNGAIKVSSMKLATKHQIIQELKKTGRTGYKDKGSFSLEAPFIAWNNKRVWTPVVTQMPRFTLNEILKRKEKTVTKEEAMESFEKMNPMTEAEAFESLPNSMTREYVFDVESLPRHVICGTRNTGKSRVMNLWKMYQKHGSIFLENPKSLPGWAQELIKPKPNINKDEVSRSDLQHGEPKIKGKRVHRQKIQAASASRPVGSGATDLRRRRAAREAENHGRRILLNSGGNTAFSY